MTHRTYLQAYIPITGTVTDAAGPITDPAHGKGGLWLPSDADLIPTITPTPVCFVEGYGWVERTISERDFPS